MTRTIAMYFAHIDAAQGFSSWPGFSQFDGGSDVLTSHPMLVFQGCRKATSWFSCKPFDLFLLVDCYQVLQAVTYRVLIDWGSTGPVQWNNELGDKRPDNMVNSALRFSSLLISEVPGKWMYPHLRVDRSKPTFKPHILHKQPHFWL